MIAVEPNDMDDSANEETMHATIGFAIPNRFVAFACDMPRAISRISDINCIGLNKIACPGERAVYGHDLVRKPSPLLAERSSCCAQSCCGSDAVGWS